jgi:hypothetical protein
MRRLVFTLLSVAAATLTACGHGQSATGFRSDGPTAATEPSVAASRPIRYDPQNGRRLYTYRAHYQDENGQDAETTVTAWSVKAAWGELNRRGYKEVGVQIQPLDDEPDRAH